jgi:C1A family cysteine protease
MSDLNLNGYRDEPENDKLWSYEDQLRDRMTAGVSGDVDLRPFTSPRHDQRSTSSCVGNSVVKALEIKRIMKHGHEAHVDLSRLAVYYLARELMFPPETHIDNGTYISHAFDALRRFGAPTEADWPWDTGKVLSPPSFMAMRNAYLHKIESFYRIRSRGEERVEEVIRCLRAGNPVVFGTYVNPTWYGVGKDHLLMPVSKNEADGRHATVLVGWVDGKFVGENSWGTGWGDDGFYYMDPSVIADDGSRDFFVAQAGWEEYK